MAYLGFGLALFLLLSLGTFAWAPLVFPLWVLVIGVHILLANLGRSYSPQFLWPARVCYQGFAMRRVRRATVTNSAGSWVAGARDPVRTSP